MTTPIYHVKGYGHQLDVYEDRAVITPTTGLISFMTRGFVGPKTIFFASIAAIEHKRMGLANGFLQFIIPGGLDRSPYHDPNTFMYGNAGADARVAEIKTYIEQRIRDIRNSQAATQHPPSSVDELVKRAKLKEQGLLSEDEFVKAKRKIIGE